jgi:hypothetical protein
MSEFSFSIDVHDRDIIVSSSEQGFRAVYYKAADAPQLMLRHRTETDDHALLAASWQAANLKARELGWIV